MMDKYSDHKNYYTFEMRSVSTDCRVIKNYDNKISYKINKQISFDTENTELTSVDYFAGSVASSIMLSIIDYDRSNNQLIEEIEAKFSFTLKNPLTYLSVRGYKGTPHIYSVDMNIYIVTSDGEDALYEMYEQAIKNSIVYQTICSSVKFSHTIKIIY